MKIIFNKLNPTTHSLSIIINGEITEQVTLDTKTYFLHDIVHYCVETELQLEDGFWGMIAQGYRLEQLSGKNNELTDGLRYIEKIVGPVQSVFNKHMPIELFWENMRTINYMPANPHFIETVTDHITTIINQWKYLPIGKNLELEFGF